MYYKLTLESTQLRHDLALYSLLGRQQRPKQDARGRECQSTLIAKELRGYSGSPHDAHPEGDMAYKLVYSERARARSI